MLLALTTAVSGLVIAATTGTDATPYVVGGLITPSVLAGLFQTGLVVRGKLLEDTTARYESDLLRERTARLEAEARERLLRDATEQKILPAQMHATEQVARSTEVMQQVVILLSKGQR